MITINNLKKSFGSFCAVNGITFSIGQGEVLGFLGPNGAGKSTTMKMLTGFIKPSAGKVSIFGHDIETDAIEAKRIIGYLPEGAPAYGDMTVLQYLSFIAEIRGYQGDLIRLRVDYVTRQLALKSVLHRTIDNLSKGFKRRVGIAQAIIHDPQVLILDEPTDGLDPNQKHQVRELIRGLSREKTVIISTHILEEVTAVCSRAMIIAQGRVVADATPAELEARSRYHRAITIELAEPQGVLEALQALPGVASVECSEDPEDIGRFTVIPEGSQSLFEPVSDLIEKHQWQVREFYVESGRLDDVFRDLTTTGITEEEA